MASRNELFDKGLLYKGYTIQPYSPAAGTGLSNHELNQPGCYRDVKDTTCTAQFQIIRDERSEQLFDGAEGDALLPGLDHHALDAAVEYRTGRRSRNRIRARQMPFNPYTDAPIDCHPGQRAAGYLFYRRKMKRR